MVSRKRPFDLDSLAAGLRRQAAMLGAFDPLDYLPSTLSRTERATVLTRLGPDFDEVVENSVPLWRLRPDVRTRLLANITPADAGALAGKPKRGSEDSFGRKLQASVAGTGTIETATTDTAGLDETYAVRTFAINARVPDGRKQELDPAPILREIALAEEMRRKQVVLSGDLFGRAAEIAAIETFLRGKRLPAPYRVPGKPAAQRDGALLVTGIGGIGKSALIADVLARAEDDRTMPTLMLLDFDRPNLFKGDRIEILRELTRQLGRRRPELASALSAVRDSLTESSGVDFAENSSTHTHALNLLSEALGRGGTPKRRVGRGFAIIADTFEEVVRRGTDAVTDLLHWLDLLKREGGLTGLKLVVSGRGRPEMADEEFSRHFAGLIDLKGIGEEAGASLLREGKGTELFRQDQADTAARLLGGHPQALRFLKQYVEEHPKELDGLIAQEMGQKNFKTEFAQVFLYTRILGRIRDDDIVAFAHPGLALRRVTPVLIREVLAKPCGFGRLSDEKANELFNKLKRSWIVDRTEPNVVQHRRDLRRLMLPLVMDPTAGDTKQEELRDKVLRIHRAAAAWYGGHRDPTLSEREQDIEAFYHGAIVRPASIRDEAIADYAPALGLDIEDLPPQIRGAEKIIRGRGETVTKVEEQALSPRWRERLRITVEEAALKRGETASVSRRASTQIRAGKAGSSGAAGKTGSAGKVGRTSPTLPPTFAAAERRFGAEIHALWTEGEFTGVALVAHQAFGRLWAEGSRETIIESKEDPVFLAVWKSLLAQALVGRLPYALTRKDAAERMAPLYGLSPWAALGTIDNSAVVPSRLHAAGWFIARRRSRTPSTLGVREPIAKQAVLPSCFAHRLFALSGSRRTVAVAPGRTLRLFQSDVSGTWVDKVARGKWFATVGVDATESHHFEELLQQAKESGSERAVDALSKRLDTMTFRGSLLHQSRLIELHNPIIAALVPLVSENGALRSLLSFARNLEFWPRELSPDLVRRPRTADAKRLCARLVHHADMHGALLPLAEAAAQLSSNRSAAHVRDMVTLCEGLFGGSQERPPRISR